MHNSPEHRAILLLGAVILFLGINWPVMKIGLGYISPLWFALARIALGGACLFILLAALGRLRLPVREEFPVIISVGVFQVGLMLALIHTALQFLEAGRSVMLAYTTPLWAAPMAAVFLRESLGPRKLLGMALGLGGIAVLFNPDSFDFGSSRAILGNVFLIMAAVTSAAVIVHLRARGRSIEALELVPWQMVLGGAVLIPVTLLVEGAPQIQWSAPLFAVLAYNGPVTTAFCLWAYVVVMRDLPATTTAVGSLGTPVVGVLASAVFLGEPMTLAKGFGLALIASGVALVTRATIRQV
ncbi:MAG: DMT family transporter [Rhodospirillales bacterium]|nr:DMT family transporter [Rhodospirillales bacterium]